MQRIEENLSHRIMGSFSVKLAVFLLLVTPCLGFSMGTLVGMSLALLGKGGGRMTKLTAPPMPETVLVGNQHSRKWPYQSTGNFKPINRYPTFHVPNTKQSTYSQKPDLQRLQAMLAASAKGKELANKYFGPGGFNKGFRWGRKLHKRYFSVADKCEKFEQTLTSCTPVDPACVLHCIVEIAENMVDNTPVNSCTKYEDCDYPEEATCNLDQPATLNATCY